MLATYLLENRIDEGTAAATRHTLSAQLSDPLLSGKFSQNFGTANEKHLSVLQPTPPWDQ